MKLTDNIECPFCNLNYKESLIYEGKYWRIILNDNQYYLGRAIIIIKRHIEDPMEISRGEIEELQTLVRKYVKTLREMFSPDLFNYAMLGNMVRH
ncbi:MAG: HIT family protein, partial [Candidatus Methanomethylicia archaeon]